MSHQNRESAVVAAIVTMLILGVLLAGCGGPDPTPQVLVATPTAEPSQEAAPTDPPTAPPPTDMPTSEPPTAPPLTNTPTDEPPTVPPPTNTPVRDAPTSTPPPPTDTAVPDTPTPVPTKRPTNTPEISYPPPTLLAPEEKDADSLRGQVTFVWNYSRPLQGEEAFQVLIWKEGEPHWGAAELWTGTEQLIDLDTVLPQRGGPGEYLWTVVVREKGTERPLSPEAAPWRLNYLGPWDPCASCDCQNQCRQGACDSCCERCCNGCK